MFPTKRITSKETPLYADDLETIRLWIAKDAEIHITEKRTVTTKQMVTTYFGKTPGGWALLRDGKGTEYVEVPTCPICFDSVDLFTTEPFWRLKCCQNQVHLTCLEAMLKAGHSGKAIGFNHTKCPACRTYLFNPWQQWTGNLYRLLNKERQAYRNIERLEKIQNQGLPPEEQGNWAFFNCTGCKHPFCGGKISCAEEFDLDPSSMICSGCDWAREAEDHRCFEHGKDYAVFKCDFCCSPASWACGSHHYCSYCHDHGGYQHPTPCPGPGKCPLGIAHPPPITSEEMQSGKRVLSFVIGCHKCNDPNATVEYKSYNADPFTLDRKDVIAKFQYSKYNWGKAVDLEGGHLFDDDESDSELEDKQIEDRPVEVNDVEDHSEGDKTPAQQKDDILFHAPILPPPMVAQSS